MKPKTISLRRRRFMIAGVAGAAAPLASAVAAQCGSMQQDAQALADFYATHGKLVVSGRIVGADCKPIAGATLDVLHPQPGARVTTTTDGDGRFMLVTLAPPATRGRPQPLRYRVAHRDYPPQTSALHFTAAGHIPSQPLARLERDDEGVWRTTFAYALG